MRYKPTIAIDFDGVLATYDGWKGDDKVGDPLPGAIEFLKRLKAEGYNPVIHSTRQYGVLKRWVNDHAPDLGKIEIASVKPPAMAYIDDRAVRFNGSFDDALFEALAAKTWWE